MNEQRHTIDDLEDYADSSLGRIKRLTRVPHTHPGRPLRSFLKRGGYMHVNLRSDGKPRTVAVRRVVAPAFLGAPPFAGAQAARGDGSRCGTTVFTGTQVLAVRRLLSSGTPRRAVADQSGVSPALISNINTRKLWRHV